MFIRRWRRRRHEARTGERLPRDWWGVGLDFLIVVVGVYLGIALGNWNERQQQKQLERDYLERIRDDLSRAAAGADRQADTFADHAVMYEDMMVALEACELGGAVSEDRFAFALWRVGKINRPPLFGATLEELVSSGQMQLVSDPSLREALVTLVAEVRGADSTYEQINRRVLPYTNYIEQRIRMRAPNDNSGVDFEAGTFDADLVDFDFGSFCADPLFLGAASGLRHSSGFLEIISRGYARDYGRTVAALDAALGE